MTHKLFALNMQGVNGFQRRYDGVGGLAGRNWHCTSSQDVSNRAAVGLDPARSLGSVTFLKQSTMIPEGKEVQHSKVPGNIGEGLTLLNTVLQSWYRSCDFAFLHMQEVRQMGVAAQSVCIWELVVGKLLLPPLLECRVLRMPLAVRDVDNPNIRIQRLDIQVVLYFLP